MPSRHPANRLTRVGGFPERRRGCAKTRPGHLAPAGSRVEALIDFARTRSSRGDDVCAIRALRRALRKDPRHAEAAFELGVSLSRLGDLRQSVRAFAKAAGLDPGAYQASRCYREAIRVDPQDARAHQSLAGALASLDRNEEAKDAYLEALRLDPENVTAQADVGLVLQAVGKPAAAEAALRRAVDLCPKDWYLHDSLARMLWEREKDAEAEKHLRLAIRPGPGAWQPHQALGELLEATGRARQAAPMLRRAARLRPRVLL